MLSGTALRRLWHGFNTDAADTTHRQVASGSAGKINDPSTMVGSPVVDLYEDRLAIFEVGHFGPDPERQTPVGSGEGVLVEAFAARGLFAVKTWSIPGRLARLDFARVRFEGNGGKCKGDRQHDG